MAHDISTPAGEHRFKFSSERIVGKKIIGIEVYAGHVSLHLEGGGVMTLTADGPDIRISLPEPQSNVVHESKLVQ